MWRRTLIAPPAVSVIIPCLDEVGVITSMLESLQLLRNRGFEILLVDGGSSDGSTDDIDALVDQCLTTSPGRAGQMNLGAKHARGDVLWFLHADTVLTSETLADASDLLDPTDVGWGRFRVRLSGDAWLFRVIETLMEWRSRLTGIATGDQGIFIHRGLFFSVGGFDDIPLMEDIALSKKLRKRARPRVVLLQLITSSRRWEQQGVLRTILLMWRLRLAYFVGVSPSVLARHYR